MHEGMLVILIKIPHAMAEQPELAYLYAIIKGACLSEPYMKVKGQMQVKVI